MEVVRGVHQIEVPLAGTDLKEVNCYLVEGDDDRHLLIDTGWDRPEAFTALLEGLRQYRMGFSNIGWIYLTHVHADHYGQAGKIKQLSNAEIAMHQAEAALIESRYVNNDILMQQMNQMLQRNGVPDSATPEMAKVSTPIRPYVVPTGPDKVLKGGETFTVGSFEFEVINTPGHSPGHICLYEKTKKMLFSGDQVLLEITPNISFHPQSGENPLKDFLDSLERLAGLDVNFVFPGHGPVFSGLRQRIGQIVYHHEQRQLYVKSAARDELKTAWDIANSLQWGSNHNVPLSKLALLHQRLAVMETIAHLQYLVLEDKAKRVVEGEIIKYYTGG